MQPRLPLRGGVELFDGDVVNTLLVGSRVVRHGVGATLAHYEEVRDLLYDTMQRLPIPEHRRAGIRHLVVTVLVRPGLTVLGRHESQWLLGWRYSNHLMAAFDGDLVLVTEHGWVHMPTEWGDHEPRMARGA